MPGPILVVDDDADILRLVQRGLIHAGFAVITAPDGEAAIEALRRTQPSLVVTDLQLPGIDGAAVIEHLRASYPLVPAIVMSGITEMADLTGLEVLTKPFALTTLVEVVRRALEG